MRENLKRRVENDEREQARLTQDARDRHAKLLQDAREMLRELDRANTAYDQSDDDDRESSRRELMRVLEKCKQVK
jgi:hypothetical protein